VLCRPLLPFPSADETVRQLHRWQETISIASAAFVSSVHLQRVTGLQSPHLMVVTLFLRPGQEPQLKDCPVSGERTVRKGKDLLLGSFQSVTQSSKEVTS
jgi:hypothetical protein